MSDTKWADIEAEEDFGPELVTTKLRGFETKPDINGIKTVTNYIKNSRGETVKIVKRIRVINRVRKVNKDVYRRANLPKFGDANNSNIDLAVIRTNEEYAIEFPKFARNHIKKDDDDDYFFVDLQVKPTKDLKQKFKSLKEENEEERETVEKVDDVAGKYVPPNLRGSERTRDQQHKEECTVRVTNLSEDVKEQDLIDLFSSCGKIHRIYLAKHKETKSSKGFAFITYQKRSDAVDAIKKLNRHGYDNLLLNVEWAKPSTRVR